MKMFDIKELKYFERTNEYRNVLLRIEVYCDCGMRLVTIVESSSTRYDLKEEMFASYF